MPSCLWINLILGFGFYRNRNATPKPLKRVVQKKDLLDLEADKAIINSMAFNNLGVRFKLLKIEKKNNRVLLGVTLAKIK